MKDAILIRSGEVEAIRVDINDKDGNIVDIEMYCSGCAPVSAYNQAHVWPAFNDWPDYSVYCMVCGQLIHKSQHDE